jgi:phage regulator Rha-like protein
MKVQIIQDKIYEVRGEKIMLDFDLAKLYDVETRVFNQAIKRNIQSFPKDFMFRLTAKEWKEILSSQFVVTDSSAKSNSSQFVMSSLKHRSAKYLPYAFTEHGVTMLASILKSPKARKMNIAIVRAFIALKKFANKNAAVLHLVKELKDRIDEHDVQLSSIYDALENMLDVKEDETLKKINWEERERIGFKK